MSFVDKEDGENVGSLVENITIDGNTLTHTNLATFCTTDLEHLSELSQGLSEDMEHQEEEMTTIESEDMHEVIVQTQEVEFGEKMDLTEIKSKNVVPPLRPLNIAPKPAKVPISFKPVTGQQLLVLQGGTTGQQIKLLSSNQGISLANLQLAKPITVKSAAGKVGGNTLSMVQPKQLVMKKVVSQLPKSTLTKTYDTKGQQIMVVQKSEPQQQIKLIQASALTSTPTKTLTFAQAQQMGIISGSKIIPQTGSKQIILNKNQTKPIKIVPQIRSPTKILPAPQANSQGKVTQRIYLKPGGASQIIQVAGGQGLNSGQFHQINIPGKGMQYIKFITTSQPEAASTTTVSSIQTTKAPSIGTKVIPISTASANIPMSDLKTITKSVTFNKQTKPSVLPPRLHALNMNTIASSGNQVVVLPAGYTTANQSTMKVAIPALRQTLPPVKNTASLLPTSGDAVVPSTPSTHSPEISSIESNGIRPRKPCNCTKSQCLKLYCDCFANGEFCYMCNCVNCFNNLENEEHRQRAIKNCLERNPNAFRPKIGKAKDTGDAAYRKHTKGCNCKRSGCLKNYCECYEAKIACSSNCKCMGCGNIEDCIDKKSTRSSMLSDSNYAISPNASKNSFSYPTYSRTRRASTTKQAFNYVTSEVIEATCQCLLSLANNAEESEQDEELTKQQIVTEFGRCLKEIIDCSISKGNQSA